MAHDARLWEARSRISEDLLRFVGTYSALVSDRITLFNVVDPDLPAEPPVDQRMRLRAKFEALASDAVRDAFDEWFKAVSDFFLSSPKTLRDARGRSELEEMRDRGRRVESLQNSIGELVRAELTTPRDVAPSGTDAGSLGGPLRLGRR